MFVYECWDAYERHLSPEQRPIGKQYIQTLESKHIDLRTRIKQLVRRTIVFFKITVMPDLLIGVHGGDRYGATIRPPLRSIISMICKQMSSRTAKNSSSFAVRM